MEGRKHGKGEALGRLNKRSRGNPLSNYQSHYYLNKRTRGNPLSNYEPSSQQIERPRGNPLSNYNKHGLEDGGLKPVVNSTVMFVPKTHGSLLIDMLQETENDVKTMTGWGTKLVEKPGTPLLTVFIKSFPMEDGCVRGKYCLLCDNKGGKCMAKRVVYQGTCKICSKNGDGKVGEEETGFSYIGETSRQVGTRVYEHLNNVKNWKKESFIINHWMTSHSLETSPPEFKFRVLSKHKDALSRQISEAVRIRTRGNLNRKNEFATNELVRLESRKYTWETEADYKAERMKEKDLEERLVNFIAVMRNVCNVQNKRKFKMNGSDEFDCSRLRALSTDEETGVSSTNKRRKMETSTPVAFRHQLTMLSDSSPGSDCLDSCSDNDGSQVVVATTNDGDDLEEKHLLSRQMCKITITPPKPEAHVFTEARNSIAANETLDSSDTYRRRINTCPDVGFRQIVKKNVLKHARSYESHINCNNARGMDVEFIDTQGVDTEFINGLSKEGEYWIDDNGTFGLDTLFLDKEESEERQIEEIIVEKTKNKLYEIFVKTFANKPIIRPTRVPVRKGDGRGGTGGTGVPVTPGKRSLSPQPESHMGNPTKTACRTPCAGQRRVRANSSCGTHRANKPKTRQRLYTISGQRLLTQMWRNKDIQRI